jgi:hypothetical protein
LGGTNLPAYRGVSGWGAFRVLTAHLPFTPLRSGGGGVGALQVALVYAATVDTAHAAGNGTAGDCEPAGRCCVVPLLVLRDGQLVHPDAASDGGLSEDAAAATRESAAGRSLGSGAQGTSLPWRRCVATFLPVTGAAVGWAPIAGIVLAIAATGQAPPTSAVGAELAVIEVAAVIGHLAVHAA